MSTGAADEAQEERLFRREIERLRGGIQDAARRNEPIILSSESFFSMGTVSLEGLSMLLMPHFDVRVVMYYRECRARCVVVLAQKSTAEP